jgi:hypothetical protein
MRYVDHPNNELGAADLVKHAVVADPQAAYAGIADQCSGRETVRILL